MSMHGKTHGILEGFILHYLPAGMVPQRCGLCNIGYYLAASGAARSDCHALVGDRMHGDEQGKP